ncbi:ankyrin repeat-containing domain protein [Echria macrotheca]|uniref:Ankyrin repeat-containing domain protein n=1 Tax=Echria macrotheca TaxID=438768 RepID=A0AAJ0EZY2_9PEZI|nr:ankyrin repeat-containing domain protein [Echria macrotheca]
MAFFYRLSADILLLIAECLSTPRDLSALARSSRFFLGFVRHFLQRTHAKRAIRWACKTGNLPLLKSVLDASAGDDSSRRRSLINSKYGARRDPYAANEDSTFTGQGIDTRFIATPLHYACLTGQNDVVKYLLDNGADPAVPSSNLCDCISIDKYWDYVDEYRTIYYRRTIHYRGAPLIMWLPLHTAICQGNVSTAILLIEHGVTWDCATSLLKDRSFTISAMVCAVQHGLEDLVGYLSNNREKARRYKHTERIHSLDPKNRESVELEDDLLYGDSNGYSAMHYIVDCDSFEAATSMIEALLKLGISVDDTTLGGGKYNTTPLLFATCIGSFRAARALLLAGADPLQTLDVDLRAGESTVLLTNCLENAVLAGHNDLYSEETHQSREEDRIELVRELIKRGLRVDNRPALSEDMLLMIAAERGDIQLIEVLVREGGADISAESEDGKSLVMCAARVHKEFDGLLMAILRLEEEFS